MIDPISRTTAPVTLVGGAPLADGVLQACLTQAPLAFAADGGAAALIAAGVLPERVIGDLDSIDARTRRRLAGRIVLVEDQDTTDLEKCLALIDAPLVLGAGFLGGRLDHTLAALGAIAARPERAVVLVGEEDAAMHLGGPCEIDLRPGTRVSLMPLAPVRVGSRGLRWGTDGLELSPTGRSGASNEALGTVRLEPEGPGAILVLPMEELPALLAARGPGAPSRFVSAAMR